MTCRTSRNAVTTEATTITKVPATRRVADLYPHDDLRGLLGEQTEDAVKRAAEALTAGRGTAEPIEVLAGGEVLYGLAPLLAAEALGLETVEAFEVRGLDEGDYRAAEGYVIARHLDGARLHPLDQARLLRRALERERRAGARPSRRTWEATLRERLAERLGTSEDNAGRYVRILDTPLEVQQAYLDDKLWLIDAAGVAARPREVRKAIAAAIAAGEDPADAVRRHPSRTGRRPKAGPPPGRAYLDLLRRGRAQLGGRVEPVGDLSPEDDELLGWHEAAIQQIRRSARVVSREEKQATLLAKAEEIAARRLC
jgi:hypothetical protein